MCTVEPLHPDVERLASFASGHVPEEEASAISVHLAECAECRTVVEALPADTLLSLLKAPPEPVAQAASLCNDDAATATIPPNASGTAPFDVSLPPELANHPRYNVLVLLGKGGMGSVYKAEHRLMEREVALKVMNPNLMRRPAMIERFRREVKAAARFSHPNIVTAYDADQAGDAHFLIMEFVEGISLAQYVDKHGKLPVDQACDYVRQAALGLQFASEHGMVHRDIKPHNLILTTAGQVKILDFGLARLVREEAAADTAEITATDNSASPLITQESPLTEVGTLMGTADFIAPEQANDPRQADIRADIYSLGCTLYYLLAGHAPFPKGTALDKLIAHMERAPEPLAKLRSDAPAGLSRVIDRMMAKDPTQRFQTPAEVAATLRHFTAAAAALRRRVKRLLVGALSVAATVLLAALIYVQVDQGELAIETQDDRVAVLVGDKSVKLRDLAANREYVLKVGSQRLRAGAYKIDVQELPAGLQFATTAFTLKRGDKTVVSVTFDPKKDPSYLKDEALRWFPAEATYFTATNMETFPFISQYQQYFFAESPSNRGRYWKFKELLGRMDRTAYAYIDDVQRPDRASAFLRITGAINHNRVVEYFRQDWPGVTIEKIDSKGEPITLIYDAQSGNVLGGAWALIGTSDAVWAAEGKGTGKKHQDGVRRILDLREGRGISLPVAHAKDLEEIPANAGSLSIGVTPSFMKKLIPFLGSLPRTMTSSLSGTSDIELRLRTTFSNEASLTLFLSLVNLTKQGFLQVAAATKNPDVSAAITKAMESLKLESDTEQVICRMQIPSAAWAALVEAVQDMSPEKLAEKDFIPGRKK